ncbi:hypothetical protein DOTSEDRAFT_56459 [Dothistroma septosporum NZE10]|uniref:Uncharacterized protein n=1 Tax=Dothistroma septosporum (strain NZE10 / CBS 128990) TaxID=675120 RepID=N1PD23_DOTSN|nr:hypothetical protein DOTSEDRAFT_56459 [Dothistroma septosporum NZE10]
MPGLRKAALSLGLTHEKIYAKVGADGGRLYLGDVIGQAAAIRKKAAELQAVAEDEERQEKAQRVAEPKAKDDRAKSQRRAFLAEAMQMSDWDPTGTWSIQCEKLSKYDETAPQKLTMQIWRDDFRFDELHEDPDDSTNESEEDDGEDEAGKELEEDSHDPFDDEKIENYPWGKRSRSRKRPEEGAHLPRFHAKFHFAVVEGDMRILPARAQEAIVSEALLD